MKKHKIGNRFAMQAQGDSAEILIYDEIGASFWGGGVDPKQFAQELSALGTIKTLNVRLNSPGGDVFDGVTIYNQLAQHPATVNMYIDGLAASAASVIAMAGDKIYIADNATVMIHNAMACTAGDANDMRKMADVLDKINSAMASTYSKRTGVTVAAVLKMMNTETWMIGQEAVDEGFADEIMQPNKTASARFDLSHFKHAPKNAAAATCDCACPGCMDGDCEDCTMMPCDVTDCACTNKTASADAPDFYRARLKLYERTIKN